MQSKRTSGEMSHPLGASPKSDIPDLETLTPAQLYWHQNLGDIAVPELPAWQPAIDMTLEQKQSALILNRELIDSLKQNLPDSSINMILLAAFYSLVYRHTNEGNISINVSTHNPLPIFVKFDHQTLFIDLVNILTTSMEIAAHHSLTLAEISQVLREDARNLLQANNNIFVGLNHDVINTASNKHHYLHVNMLENNNGNWEITFSYNPALLSEEQIATMLAHFQNILLHVNDHTLCIISEIPIVTPTELRLSEKINQTDYPLHFNGKLLHEILNDIANENPDLPIQFYHPTGGAEPEVMTYGQLNRRSSQIANYLREVCNIKPGNIVAVNIARSLDIAAFWFGTMKAGAVWMPLDATKDSRQENEAKIIRAGATFVVGTNDTLPTSSSDKFVTLNLSDSKVTSAIELTDDTYHHIALAPHRPAYISHTSGSTEAPKPAVNSHAGLRNLASATIKMKYQDRSRVFTFSLAIHDPFINDFVVAIVTKGCVHFTSDFERTSPVIITEIIRKYQLTFAALPPEIMCLIPAGTSLQEVHIMGESPYLRKLIEWKTAKPGLRLFLGYGPTEGTVMSLLHDYNIGDDTYVLGRPIANTKIFILNPKTYTQCGRSVVGEIFIAGDCINFNSYANNAEKTNEKFRWLKFDASAKKFIAAEPYDEHAFRVYATGDNGSYELGNDGEYVIKYHGRYDDRIKINNIMVDLNALAGQIREHPDIDKAVVILYKDPEGKDSNRLVAYVVPKKNRRFLQSTIDEVLLAHLIAIDKKNKVERKIPFPQFELLKNLPISANNKINKKKLPAPRPIPPINISEDDDLTDKVTKVWLSLSLRPDTTFGDSGGTSLMMAQLEMRLNDRNGHFQLSKPIGFNQETGLSYDMTIDSLVEILRPLTKATARSVPALNHDPRLLRGTSSSLTGQLIKHNTKNYSK